MTHYMLVVYNRVMFRLDENWAKKRIIVTRNMMINIEKPVDGMRYSFLGSIKPNNFPIYSNQKVM